MSWNTVKHPLLISTGKKPRTGSVVSCYCGVEFYRKPYQKSKFCSHQCYWSSMKGRTAPNKGANYPQLTGANNHQWKENASYSAVHNWLRRHFGKASKCEHCETTTAKSYDWALKKGYEYQKKRENFIELCRSCHQAYDDMRAKMWRTRRGME